MWGRFWVNEKRSRLRSIIHVFLWKSKIKTEEIFKNRERTQVEKEMKINEKEGEKVIMKID